MAKKIHVAVIFNEPTVATATGRKFISETGKIEAGATRAQVISGTHPALVDLSEVGVLEERAQVQDALAKNGYKTSLFNMNSDIKRLIQFIEEKDPDLIFNLCESVGDESTHEMFVAGLYELMGIPYTGASAFSLGMCQNKARTKQILSFYKIRVPKFALYKNANEVNEEEFDLRFPVIVKPSLEDASVGIDNGSIVDSISALRKRVRVIFQNYDQPAIVDEYIEGRELNVAVIGNRRPIALPISEIDFSGLPADFPHIVTYNAKWMEATTEFKGTVGVCPAPISQEIERQAKEIALKCYRIMGCRDYARVDMRLDKNNNLHVIEVNPNPDISDDAGFARSARAYGFSFDEIINKIVEYARAYSVMGTMAIRPFRKEDVEPLVALVEATKVFREEEVAVARELMEIVAEDKDQKDYMIATYADEDGTVRGYYCVGHTPMTETTYDLYWIAVDPRVHGKGIGNDLLHHCEDYVRKQGGTLIIAETSLMEKYSKTRQFYEHQHYIEASRIHDYYAPGDGLVVYVKYL